jgi:hypothetical protein
MLPIYYIIPKSSLPAVARASADVQGRRERASGTTKRNDLTPTNQQHVSLTILNMLGVIDFIAAFLIFCLASSVSLFLHVPLLGALVRFRANYTPKGLQIGEEGGVTPHVGPVVPNYLAMLLRVKRIEVSDGISAVGCWLEACAVTALPLWFKKLTRFLYLLACSTLGMVWSMEGIQFVPSSSYRVVVQTELTTLPKCQC